jgi:hypothetical protein
MQGPISCAAVSHRSSQYPSGQLVRQYGASAFAPAKQFPSETQGAPMLPRPNPTQTPEPTPQKGVKVSLLQSAQVAPLKPQVSLLEGMHVSSEARHSLCAQAASWHAPAVQLSPAAQPLQATPLLPHWEVLCSLKARHVPPAQQPLHVSAPQPPSVWPASTGPPSVAPASEEPASGLPASKAEARHVPSLPHAVSPSQAPQASPLMPHAVGVFPGRQPVGAQQPLQLVGEQPASALWSMQTPA